MLHLRTPHPGRSHCKEGSRRLAHLWEGPSPWVLLVGAAGPQAPQLPMGTRDGAGAQANQLWGCTSVLVGGFDSPPPRPLSALLGLGRSLPSHASDLPKTCCSGLTSVQIRPAAGGSSGHHPYTCSQGCWTRHPVLFTTLPISPGASLRVLLNSTQRLNVTNAIVFKQVKISYML